MIICYDGTRYFGWEHQPGRETVQGKLENVLSRMCGKEVEIIGAGRTDAGVHARAMCANVRLDVNMQPGQIRDYMNRYLPEDIAVRDVRIASDKFHARYNALGKTYRYTFHISEVKPVFDRKYVNAIGFCPDIEAMKQASSYIIGTHDFKSFCGNSHMKKSTVRTVDSILITKKKDMIHIYVHGNGFLQHMVRIIAGTLLEAGQGRFPPEHVAEIIEAKDRTLAGPTAPACGLCLICVDY